MSNQDPMEVMHRRAFRVAYDYLAKFWPPKRSTEYTDAALAELVRLTKGELEENPLGQKLCAEIYWYLGDTVREKP